MSATAEREARVMTDMLMYLTVLVWRVREETAAERQIAKGGLGVRVAGEKDADAL